MTTDSRPRPHRLLLAAALAAAPLGAAAPLAVPAAAQEQKISSPEIGKPLQEAQKLIADKKYDAALAKVDQADKAGRKTPYDTSVIEQMRGVAYAGKGDYLEAAAAFEAHLATGQVAPADAQQRKKMIAQLYYQGGDKAKAAEAARAYIKQYGDDKDLSVLLASVAIGSDDYAAAGASARQAIEAAKKRGETPDEQMLQLQLTAAYKSGDKDATIAALEDLIRSYPKEEYWRDIIKLTEQTEGFDRKALGVDVYRLMAAADIPLTAEERIDMSESALVEGFPGEAQKALDDGFSAGVLGQGADAERQRRLLETARQRAADDRATLPAQEKEARAAGAGQPLVKLGEAFIGYGDYAKAAELLQAGLAKGGVPDASAARLHLGEAQYQAGQKDAALQTWKALQASDAKGGAGRLARIWTLLAQTEG